MDCTKKPNGNKFDYIDEIDKFTEKHKLAILSQEEI